MIALVHMFQNEGKSWTEISRELGRTIAQCYQAYTNGAASSLSLSAVNVSVDPDQVPSFVQPIRQKEILKPMRSFGHRTWTNEDDEKLVSLVTKLGNRWKRIGEEFNRTGVQVIFGFTILDTCMRSLNISPSVSNVTRYSAVKLMAARKDGLLMIRLSSSDW